MKRVMVVAAVLLAASALCLLPLPAEAQSYTVLHPFRSLPRNPVGLVQASDGSFYGTTEAGGTSDLGTVFKITPAGELTTLHSFAESEGWYPQAALVQGTDGNFYGTTKYGGVTPFLGSGYGTVFRITPAGELTTLHLFTGSDGAEPAAALVQGTDGNFYGTAGGVIFRITPGGTLTKLASGGGSGSLVQGTDGNFYGRTGGTVFKLTPEGELTTLHSFTANEGLDDSNAALVQGADGNFYGTMSYGASNYGTVFRITPAGELATLHSFDGSDGARPHGGLVQGTDGNFYGTTGGTVFRITPAGALTTLHSFAESEGWDPRAALVQSTDGNFYGTTSSGGVFRDYGTVFKITLAGELTTLCSFTGSDGSTPRAGLVQGTDGNFYGTTASGGTSGYGTVFTITPAGALTTLHSFSGSDGRSPYATLVQGPDGNFYGTTAGGGSGGGYSGYGTVFKVTPAGELTTLHSFGENDGSNSQAALVQGTDGNFYGTTTSGGVNSFGTVFRITPAGVLTTLYSFRFSDGIRPYAALVQGTDGNFYGTTGEGGAYDLGTIFKITPDGTFTTLYSFPGIDGAYLYATLVKGTDGNFYGTTYGGGDLGTVFQITPAGALTTLHSFAGSEGRYPLAALVQGSDGDFYGTTSNGGASNYGTVFKITPAGTLTTLYSFAPGDGKGPISLVQGSDGNFYGTMYSGGPLGAGVVFRLTPGPGPSPTVTGVSPASGPVPGGTAVTISGTEFQPGATVSFDGTAATGVTYISATTIYFHTPAHAAGAATVTVTNPDLQAGSLSAAFTYTCYWTGEAFNGGPYCVGGTISLTTPTFSGATYSWTGPSGFTSALQNPTIVNATVASAGTYSVTVTVAGCASEPGTTNVVFKAPPATPTASNNGPVCERGTIYLSTPTVPGATYSWTGPSGFTSAVQNPSFTEVTAANAGTYSVTVTFAGSGCTSAPGTTNVVVKAPPATPTASNTGPYCAGATIELSTPAVSGATYAWIGPNGFTSALQNPTVPSAMAANAGTYTYRVSVTVAGCTSTPGWTDVVVNPLPPTPVIIQTTGTNPSCAGAPIAIDAGAGYTSYAWSTGATTRTITVSPATTTTYSVTGTNAGCSSAAGSWTQTVNPVPAIPVITAPASTLAGTTGLTASVVPNAGSNWSWNIQNGTITAGQGTSQITFTAGMGGTLALSVTETNASGCVSAPGNATVTIAPAAASFYVMTPCRIVDTRNPNGPLGGPSVAAQSTRSFALTGTTCGLPQSASGVSMNVTVADATSAGSLTMYPGTGAAPGTNTLSFNAGRNRANNVILGLPGGLLSVQNKQPSGTVNLIIDVNGYFQ